MVSYRLAIAFATANTLPYSGRLSGCMLHPSPDIWYMPTYLHYGPQILPLQAILRLGPETLVVCKCQVP